MNGNYIMELRKFVSPEIVYGTDARLMIGQYISNFESEHPMIVTDRGVSSQLWFSNIISKIDERVKNYTIFDRTTPNPKDFEAMDGAEEFLKNRCDLLIAVGGGSPMDCAKCISIVSTNGGHILDYEGVDQVGEPGPPLICIPSTAGTSADVSQFAIIRDSTLLVKKAVISKRVVPDLALIDPVPLLTVDTYLAACTGMDALTHAIEAYVSNAHSDLTDVRAIEAIRLLGSNILNILSTENTVENIYPLMLGSLQAGLAFSNASLGAVHAMAHSLGGLLDLAHGECNSILLGHIIEENFDAAAGRYTDVAAALGIDVHHRNSAVVKNHLLAWINETRQKLGIKDKIVIENYSMYDTALINNALKDPCMITNPKELSAREVRKVYEKIIIAR